MESTVSAQTELIDAPDHGARWWRRAADTFTYGRTAVAGAVCLSTVAGIEAMPETIQRMHAHGLDFESYTLAGAFAVMGAMDKLDGMAARRAAKLGLPPTDKDKKKDPLHDKIFAYMAMTTATTMLTAEGILTKDYKKVANAGGIVLNMAALAVRDVKMTLSRKIASDNDRDPSAIPINKKKTGAQNAVHTLVMSPLPSWVTWPAYSFITGWAWLGYKIADRVHKGEEYPGIVEATRRVVTRQELELAA